MGYRAGEADYRPVRRNGLLLSRIFFIVLIAAGLVTLSGCTVFKAGLAAFRSLDEFKALDSDPRVFYQAGAESLAREVSGYLDAAIETVERDHYRQFAKPVAVYVCASRSCITQYTGASGRGVVFREKLFISPRAAETNAVKGILTHELSHLHLNQQLGTFKYASHLPAWFVEGLAVNVSGGAGAERVTARAAGEAIAAGERFTPETSGSILFLQSASSYGLKPHMFYRQAALFVGFLQQMDTARFKAFFLKLQDGERFDKAFHSAFQMEIGEAWVNFIRDLDA